MLVKIIEARVSEIFDLVQQELKKFSPKSLLPAGVVLTGGGSKLPKIVELAKKELKLPVRIGVPRGIEGLEEDPCWGTVSGLVLEGQESESEGSRGVLSRETIITKVKKIFKIFVP